MMLLALLTSAAMAANPSSVMTKPATTKNAANPQGLWILASGNGGALNSDINASEGEGTQMGARGIASFYTENMIYNGGLNLDNIRLRDQERFNTMALDLSARYRLTEKWSAGVESVGYVDQGEKFKGTGEDLTPFVGVGAFRDFAYNDTLIRAGARAMVDTSFANQTVTLAQAMVDIGIGAGAQEQSAPAANAAAAVAPKATAQTATEFKALSLPFEVNSAELSQANAARLQRVATLLGKNAHLFGAMEIRGHADQTGPASLNAKLSEQRALTVAEVFQAEGRPATVPVNSVALGSTAPISAENLAANRRTEIILKDVKNIAAIRALLDTVQ